ncbi:hypothetical protein C1646_697726 [Rhizophagus diaphanus]|nr:hypothetical protein C1646_697726 [Rhizophagus diaphanus] [Rhizophagus sp. MUCL 43196]
MVSTLTISSVAPVVTTTVTVTTTPELTEELRKFRDSLPPETLMYYNLITSHESKVAYLESLRATVRVVIKREHKKGESVIKLLVNLTVLLIIILFIVIKSNSNNPLYDISSFIISYSV